MIDLRPYTDRETGEINLCAAFYDYMKHRKRGVRYFALAITGLEEMMNEYSVTDEAEALSFIQAAVTCAYKGDDAIRK